MFGKRSALVFYAPASREDGASPGVRFYADVKGERRRFYKLAVESRQKKKAPRLNPGVFCFLFFLTKQLFSFGVFFFLKYFVGLSSFRPLLHSMSFLHCLHDQMGTGTFSDFPVGRIPSNGSPCRVSCAKLHTHECRDSATSQSETKNFPRDFWKLQKQTKHERTNL